MSGMARALLVGQALSRVAGPVSMGSRPAQLARNSCYHARSGPGTSRARYGCWARQGATKRAARCDHDGVVNSSSGVQYDVLVVGAGPSGASAAYWLATLGHRVLV